MATTLDNLKDDLQSRLGFGTVSTIVEDQMVTCLNAAIQQLAANNEAISDDALTECLDAAVTQLASNHESISDDTLTECLDAAVVQLASNHEDVSDDALTECLDGAVAQLASNHESTSDAALTECLDAAVSQLASNHESTSDDVLTECLDGAVAQLASNHEDFTENSLTESVNAGIQRAISDGIPGLTRDTYTAETYGDLSITLTGASVGDTTDTIASGTSGTGALENVDNICPMDLLKVGDTVHVLKEAQISAGVWTVYFGSYLATAIAGGAAATIHRRGIRLPTSGKVIGIYDITNGNNLEYNPTRLNWDPTETGTPFFFEQRWDKYAENSILTLYPAPTTKTRFRILQQENYYQNTSLSWPEEALDAVLERARKAFISFRGNATPVEASLADDAVTDTSDQLKDSSSAQKIFIRE